MSNGQSDSKFFTRAAFCQVLGCLILALVHDREVDAAWVCACDSGRFLIDGEGDYIHTCHR